MEFISFVAMQFVKKKSDWYWVNPTFYAIATWLKKQPNSDYFFHTNPVKAIYQIEAGFPSKKIVIFEQWRCTFQRDKYHTGRFLMENRCVWKMYILDEKIK